MECEELRRESEMEADSDHEDADYGGGEVGTDGGWLGHSMSIIHTDLDSFETGTVRKRAKTIVTPKMAMESFRLSFLNDDQDVNFDAILGELYELESQLTSAQSELSRSLGTGCHHPPPPAAFQDGNCQHSNQTAHVSEQEELDQLAVEITRSLRYNKSPSHCQQHHRHYHHQAVAGLGMAGGEGVCDTIETDSAFSDNASLPSSESLTSMVTVSSCADTASSSSGDASSMSGAICGVIHSEAEQMARMKAEKIRIALEKIKEAKIRKLFVRAFTKDGSSKSILVDEKMSVGQICSQLADKNHMRLNHKLTVLELLPELLMERILEDHDSLVENIVMWTRDSKNKVMFEERVDKYDLFINPEKYLLGHSSVSQDPLTVQQKQTLIQEFFAIDSVSVPSVEGALYLKSDGKKAWKKFFFVLRASGLYYSPKGKACKNPKDLVCLVQFEYVEVYRGLGWKKKYHSPTDYCFALKHPQIQKKASKYIRYFCAETDTALEQWIMGIRTVKLGKQMLYNYEQLMHEISIWDLRQHESGTASLEDSVCQMLNHTDLNDSRMSVTEHGVHHSILNPLLTSESSRDIISIEVLAIPSCRGSECGGGSDARSLSGSVGSSSIGSGISESGHKTPIKRVSFSATNSIINGDSGEHTVKHRDSIISASTDSSEDSNSSGEIRIGTSFRGKMRPKLPVTTETTRQLADMCNVSMDETAEGIYADTHHRISSAGISRCDRKRSTVNEHRGSNGSAGSDNGQRSSHLKNSSLSPSLKQHSLDSGEVSVIRGKHRSPSPDGHYQHVRRKSEPSVVPHATKGKEEAASSTYSPMYSPLREEQRVLEEMDPVFSCTNDQENLESFYNEIRSAALPWSDQLSSDVLCPTAILPPPEFRETAVRNHTSSSSHLKLTPPPPPAPPVQVQSMQVPPPPPPVSSNKSGHEAETANNQQKLHQLKDSHHKTAASILISHSKSSPPPTFPKPHSSQINNVSITPSPNVTPKQPPPPPPLRMCSNESSCSSKSESDSPLHVPISLPIAPITPRLPPPTLPKTSHATTAAATSVMGNTIKPLLSSKQPTGDEQSKKENGESDHSQTRQELQHTSIVDEIVGYPPQSPSMSLLSELSKTSHLESEADTSNIEMRNGHSLSSSQQHRRSASTGGVDKADKKTLPPPPPKRNESTRLSGHLVNQQQHLEAVPNGTSIPVHDPIYENFDGIMEIDELPLPPPELLMDLPPSECEDLNYMSTKKAKPPPPPPKRSKETHLSNH